MRQPVRFAEVVAGLCAAGPAWFVEMSPHPVLVPAVVEVAQASGHDVTATGSLCERGHRTEVDATLRPLVAALPGGTRALDDALVAIDRCLAGASP